jgi:hypothetical protein
VVLQILSRIYLSDSNKTEELSRCGLVLFSISYASSHKAIQDFFGAGRAGSSREVNSSVCSTLLTGGANGEHRHSDPKQVHLPLTKMRPASSQPPQVVPRSSQTPVSIYLRCIRLSHSTNSHPYMLLADRLSNRRMPRLAGQLTL